MKLSEIKRGERCRVTQVKTDRRTLGRLKMLNIYVGSTVTVEGRSIFKKNILVYSDGVRAALRLSCAELIRVEPLD